MSVTLGLIHSVLLGAGLQGPLPPPPPPVRIGLGIPETGDGLIEGVVRRLDTGAPLPDARVTLTGLPAPAGAQLAGAMSIREALTDASD